jgi:hypothetical protein
MIPQVPIPLSAPGTRNPGYHYQEQELAYAYTSTIQSSPLSFSPEMMES